MAQKQKLKSERGSLNVGIKDMFMTMDPDAFRIAVDKLAKLRDTDKDGFNEVLEKFEVLKKEKQEDRYCENILVKKIFRNIEQNAVIRTAAELREQKTSRREQRGKNRLMLSVQNGEKQNVNQKEINAPEVFAP